MGGVASVINDTATQWRLFSSLYWQLGGNVLADEGRKVILDDAKAEQVLAYLSDLTNKRQVLPTTVDYGGAQTLFASGKAGFYFEGDWEVTTFITSKTPFSMTRFPNVFGGPYACQADSHSFVLPRDASRTEAKRKLILGFVRSMLDQSSTWAAGGHIPAWIPFQKSPDYDKIKPQSNYKGVADSVRYDDPAWYSGSGSDFENVTGFAISAVFAGQLHPAAAVNQMRSGLQKYADTPSPV
jgi:multiple sugar transport system substrate-binding protein